MAFLNEIGLERLWTHILAKLNTKVDKADGMGLSENNYTNDDKENLTNVINDVNALNTLVGDKSVSEQIDEAISASEKNNIGLVVIEGNPAVIENGVEGLGILATTSFSANQSGSGDPSPDNVRTISGWTGTKLTRTGKNLFKEITLDSTYSANGMTATITDEGMIINGSTDAYKKIIDSVISLISGTYYISGGEASNIYAQLTVTNKDGTKSYYVNKSFTIKGDEQELRLMIQSGSNNIELNNYMLKPMLNIGSIAEPFELYNGEDFSVDFGKTIYGGKLDWNTGLLTVTHEEIASYNNEELPLTWLSDRNVYSEGTVPTIGAQVVYELSEPYTIQLDQHQIPELSGVNTVYTNCGNNRVIFNAYLNNVINDLLVTDDGNGNVVFTCSIGTMISDENTYLTVNN